MPDLHADPSRDAGMRAWQAAAAARALAPTLATNAALLDVDGAFPADDVRLLADAGLLAAPLPATLGGCGLGTEPTGTGALVDVLRVLGRCNLSLGRLYEGHVNALRLVCDHGTPAQREAAAHDTANGLLFGVWNTDGATAPLRLTGGDPAVLAGGKILASGAGFVARALVTAAPREGERQMLLLPLEPGTRADLSRWTPQGMKASATGSIDLDGLAVAPAMHIGGPGDYTREPAFSGGAWRFAAVHLGGLEALLEAARRHLVGAGRAGDPHQLARLGTAAIAAESARLWIESAALMAEAPDPPPARTVAYVGLARLAVEDAALQVIQLVQRSIGLAAFMRPSPLERIARDLATYLRQPAPDRALTNAAAHVAAADAAIGDQWT